MDHDDETPSKEEGVSQYINSKLVVDPKGLSTYLLKRFGLGNFEVEVRFARPSCG